MICAAFSADEGVAPSSRAKLPSEPVVSTGGIQQTMSEETARGWTSEAVSSCSSLTPWEVSGFQSEGLHVNKEKRECLADLSYQGQGQRVLARLRPFQTRDLEL